MELSDISSKNEMNPILKNSNTKISSSNVSSERANNQDMSLYEILKCLYPSIKLPKGSKNEFKYLDLEFPPPSIVIEKVPEQDMESSKSMYIQNITPENASELVNEKIEKKYNDIKDINSLFAIQEEIYIIEKVLNAIEQKGTTNEYLDKKYNDLVDKYEKIQKNASEKVITPEEYLVVIKNELKNEEQLLNTISKKKKIKHKEFYQNRILKRIKVIRDEINQTESFIRLRNEKIKEVSKSPKYIKRKEKLDFLKGLYDQYEYAKIYCENNNIEYEQIEIEQSKIMTFIKDYISLSDEDKDHYDIDDIPIKQFSLKDFFPDSIRSKQDKLTSLLSHLQKESDYYPSNSKDKELRYKLIEKLKDEFTIINDNTLIPRYNIVQTTFEEDSINEEIGENSLQIKIGRIFFPDTEEYTINRNCYLNVCLLNVINEIVNKPKEKENYDFVQNYHFREQDYNVLNITKLEFFLIFQGGFCCGSKELYSFVDLKQLNDKSVLKGIILFKSDKKSTKENGTKVEIELSIRKPFVKQNKRIINRELIEITNYYERFNESEMPSIITIKEDDIIIIDKNEIEHYDDINNLNYISVLNITKENIQKKNKTSSKIELIDKKVIQIQKRLEDEKYKESYISKGNKQIKIYQEMIHYCKENKIKKVVPKLKQYIKGLQTELNSY